MDLEGRRLERLIASDPAAALKFAIHQERADGAAWMIHAALTRILTYYNYPGITGIAKVSTLNVSEVLQRSLDESMDEIITWIPNDQEKHGPYHTVGLTAVRYAKLPEDVILNLAPVMVENTNNPATYPSTDLSGNLTGLAQIEQSSGHREPALEVSQAFDYTNDLKIMTNGLYLRTNFSQLRPGEIDYARLLEELHFEAYQRPIDPSRTEYFISVIRRNNEPTHYVAYQEPGMTGISVIEQQGPIRQGGRIVSFLKWNIPIGQAPFEPEWRNFLDIIPETSIRRSILHMTVPHRIRFTNLNNLRRWIFLVQNNYFVV